VRGNNRWWLVTRVMHILKVDKRHLSAWSHGPYAYTSITA
jgi:hypothetical protein